MSLEREGVGENERRALAGSLDSGDDGSKSG